MELERAGRRFHLEINGIDEFSRFCALIRGEAVAGLTQAQIDAMALKLNQSSDPLAAALDQQKDK